MGVWQRNLVQQYFVPADVEAKMKNRPSARHMMKTFSPVTWESGVDRTAPSWDLMLKPPVAQKICTFAWRLQQQAGMAAAAIPATMGDDGYKFLMQKPARPIQRYMNPVDFSESRQGSICFFALKSGGVDTE